MHSQETGHSSTLAPMLRGVAELADKLATTALTWSPGDFPGRLASTHIPRAAVDEIAAAFDATPVDVATTVVTTALRMTLIDRGIQPTGHLLWAVAHGGGTTTLMIPPVELADPVDRLAAVREQLHHCDWDPNAPLRILVWGRIRVNVRISRYNEFMFDITGADTTFAEQIDQAAAELHANIGLPRLGTFRLGARMQRLARRG